jgi:hypothetical protein
VKLYRANEVERAAALQAKAQAKLGGVSSGIGFWGSPTWVIGGALVLGSIEQALGSGMAREGQELQREALGIMTRLRDNGTFIPVEEIQGELRASTSSLWVCIQGMAALDPTRKIDSQLRSRCLGKHHRWRAVRGLLGESRSVRSRAIGSGNLAAVGGPARPAARSRRPPRTSAARENRRGDGELQASLTSEPGATTAQHSGIGLNVSATL